MILLQLLLLVLLPLLLLLRMFLLHYITVAAIRSGGTECCNGVRVIPTKSYQSSLPLLLSRLLRSLPSRLPSLCSLRCLHCLGISIFNK